MDREGVGRGGNREVTGGNSRKGRSGSKAREVSEGMGTLFYFFPLCWFLIWEYIRYGCFAFILGNFFSFVGLLELCSLARGLL